MSDLRNKVIRLAHANPELRPHLIPLVGKLSVNDPLLGRIQGGKETFERVGAMKIEDDGYKIQEALAKMEAGVRLTFCGERGAASGGGTECTQRYYLVKREGRTMKTVYLSKTRKGALKGYPSHVYYPQRRLGQGVILPFIQGGSRPNAMTLGYVTHVEVG